MSAAMKNTTGVIKKARTSIQIMTIPLFTQTSPAEALTVVCYKATPMPEIGSLSLL